MITVSVNLNDIDKSALYEGKKGKYLNLTLMESKNDQYGNSHFVVQDLGKERREAGERGKILGNAKTFSGGGGKPAGGNSDSEDLF